MKKKLTFAIEKYNTRDKINNFIYDYPIILVIN